MYSDVLCVDTPSRRRGSSIVDTQPTSADGGESAAFDTPADVGWDRMIRDQNTRRYQWKCVQGVTGCNPTVKPDDPTP